MKKILINLFPTLAFLISYKYYHIITSTYIMLITLIITTLYSYFRKAKKISNIYLLSLSIITVSALMSIATGNPIYIKIKPTIIYSLLCITFLVSTITKKPLLQKILHNNVYLTNQSWDHLHYRFAIFFIIIAILNEVIWRFCTEKTWVLFKIFGITPLITLFIILQIPFIYKNNIKKY